MRCFAIVMAACSAAPSAAPMQPASPVRVAAAQLSLAADDRMIAIPAGRCIVGSTPEERAAAYDDALLTSGNDAARVNLWFEREADRHVVTLPAFRIDLMPVTQSQFAEFVTAEHVAAPAIDEAAWRAQGFPLDYATQVARFVWNSGRPPDGREDHPVVLVTWADADRCAVTSAGCPRRRNTRRPRAATAAWRTRGATCSIPTSSTAR